MYSTRYSCRILIKLEVFRQIFEKKKQISRLIKIRPVGAELFHAGGRIDEKTDMTELTVAFRNFANVHKKCTLRQGQ